jgi:hypothetical protein
MNAPNSHQVVTLQGIGNATPDFAVSASPSSATVTRGSSANFTFTVTPINGFNQAVTFACAGLPELAQCNFVPSSVTPNGSPVISTLTITTTAPVNAGNQGPAFPRHPFSLLASLSLSGLVAGFMLMGNGRPTRRKKKALLLLAVALSFLMSGLVACGNGGASTTTVTKTVSPGTPTGTSTVTVVSSAGGSLHAATIAITVN